MMLLASKPLSKAQGRRKWEASVHACMHAYIDNNNNNNNKGLVPLAA